MNQSLLRALVIGALLAVAGVGLFLLMFFVVLSSLADLPRLFGSLIVPPLVMAVLLGGYYLFVRNQS